jgi:hypothetical protein
MTIKVIPTTTRIIASLLLHQMTYRNKMLSWGERLFLLRSLPVAILVVIAALDRADMALLGASFPMLEKTLGVHGKVLAILFVTLGL